MELTNKELANLYTKIKNQKKHYKEKHRQSLYDLNKYLEYKECLAVVKLEMKRRGLKKKEAKKLSNF
ncbi:hypothetical protein ACIQ34_08980 [Ureibacillus sp. NPDC094379]